MESRGMGRLEARGFESQTEQQDQLSEQQATRTSALELVAADMLFADFPSAFFWRFVGVGTCWGTRRVLIYCAWQPSCIINDALCVTAVVYCSCHEMHAQPAGTSRANIQPSGRRRASFWQCMLSSCLRAVSHLVSQLHSSRADRRMHTFCKQRVSCQAEDVKLLYYLLALDTGKASRLISTFRFFGGFNGRFVHCDHLANKRE